MTNKQLQQLLRDGIRQVSQQLSDLRGCYQDRATKRIAPRSMAFKIARTEMWLARARKAVAGPKAARRKK